MFGLGMPELIVILIIAVLIFGASRLPELGSSLGKAIKGFKEASENREPDETECEGRGEEEGGRRSHHGHVRVRPGGAQRGLDRPVAAP